MLRHALLVIVMLLTPHAYAGPASIFDPPGQRATHAVVTLGIDLPDESMRSTPMLARLSGVISELSGIQMNRLRGSVPREFSDIGNISPDHRLYSIHCIARRATVRVDVFQDNDGRLMVRSADGTVAQRLDQTRFAELAQDWARLPAQYPEPGPDEPIAQVFELSKPLMPGWVTVDDKTLKERFLPGIRRIEYPSATRVLDDETIFVRLPEGYDPKKRWGLIVWIDPTPDGRPWPQLYKAADTQGFILVSAKNAGNDRPVGDRFQLAFDGIATIMDRYNTDPQRIYASGMSGGGRVSSILLGTHPDIFMGAVAVVGLSNYRNVSIGNGKYWPAGYGKPATRLMKLLRQRRLAAVTGPLDFNYTEMKKSSAMYQASHINARLFEYEDMAHVMATPDRYAAVLAWVDEPAQQRKAQYQKLVQAILDVYLTRYGNTAPVNKAQRDLLEKVTAKGPWSESAYKAAQLLGVIPHEADSN